VKLKYESNDLNYLIADKSKFSDYTPLMVVLIMPLTNIECIKILISLGTEFKVKTKNGNNLIHLAAIYDKTDFIEYAT
jgi:hypothetical protein